MKIQLVSAVILALASAGGGYAAGDPNVVDLGYVKYRGKLDENTNVRNFLGMRFAKPPTGNLRWQKPESIDQGGSSQNDSIQDASKLGSMCVQGIPKFQAQGDVASPEGSEDCLFLNVQVPGDRKSSDKKLPVLVHIHGGGYLSGSADATGVHLISHSGGSIIYASIQYRLGMFGFLGGSEIQEHGTLNAGLYDQRLALEWIKKHISKFGGDPDKITIIGDSAGGGSVTMQLTAFDGEKGAPFSAAVAEFPWWTPYYNEKSQKAAYDDVLKQANCTDFGCLKKSSEDVLKMASAKSLMVTKPQYAYGLFGWSPVIDGDIVKRLPSEAFEKGLFTSVPTIVDHSTKEGFTFTNITWTAVPASLAEQETVSDAKVMFPYATDEFFDELFNQTYPTKDFGNVFYQRTQWFGDYIINCPTKMMADGIVEKNKKADNSSFQNMNGVYKLVFNDGTTMHGAIQAYLFAATKKADVSDPDMADLVSDYYVNFIKSGDPNKGDFKQKSKSPYWPEYSFGSRVVQIEPNEAIIVEDPEVGDQCNFWRKNTQQTLN